jgi:hypothetical protein
MSSARSMLARVARLETAGTTPCSPIELAYGSLGAWEAEVQADIASGKADPVEMPVVLKCIRRWHDEKLWGAWRQDRRVWEFGR